MTMKLPTLEKVKQMMKRIKTHTIVRDMLGNILTVDMLLYWRTLNAVVRVKEIHPGGIEIPSTKQLTPGEIVLEIRLPFDSSQPQAFLKDLIAVIDPLTSMVSPLSATPPDRSAN